MTTDHQEKYYNELLQEEDDFVLSQHDRELLAENKEEDKHYREWLDEQIKMHKAEQKRAQKKRRVPKQQSTKS